MVPLFCKNKKNEPDLIGSSTFVNIGINYFLLTAAHVVEYFYTNVDYYTLFGQYYESFSVVVLHGEHRIKNDDYALLHIDYQTAKKMISFGYQPLVNCPRCLNYNYISKYFISGFPSSRSKPRKRYQFNSELVVLETDLVPEEICSSLNLDLQKYLFYTYPKYRKDSTKFVNPQGMSGGGVFSETCHDGIKIYELRGIIIDRYKTTNKFNFEIHIALSCDYISKTLLFLNPELYFDKSKLNVSYICDV